MVSVVDFSRAGRLQGYIFEELGSAGEVSLRHSSDIEAFIYEWFFEIRDKRYRQQFAVDVEEIPVGKLDLKDFGSLLSRVFLDAYEDIEKSNEN